MTFTKRIIQIIALLFASVLFTMTEANVQADTQTVPLSVLKDGTNNTSYAASYFANTANVTSEGNGAYTITSTITTNKALGDYPVQMLSINGAPANVSKSDNGTSQIITYSFQTRQLNARHAAVIKVDVDSLNYHHTYNVGLQVDASAVRDATEGVAQSEAKAARVQGGHTSSDGATDKGDSPDNNQVKQESANRTETQQSNQTNNQKNKAASHSTKEASQLTKASTREGADSNEVATTNKKQRNDVFMKQLLAIIVGGLGIGVLVAVGMIWFVSRKK